MSSVQTSTTPCHRDSRRAAHVPTVIRSAWIEVTQAAPSSPFHQRHDIASAAPRAHRTAVERHEDRHSDVNEPPLERRHRASCETQRQRRGLNAILNAILNASAIV